MTRAQKIQFLKDVKEGKQKPLINDPLAVKGSRLIFHPFTMGIDGMLIEQKTGKHFTKQQFADLDYEGVKIFIHDRKKPAHERERKN